MIEDLLHYLVCPSTGGRLILSEDRSCLISPIAKLSYPIRNNIPIMVIDQASIVDGQILEKYL